MEIKKDATETIVEAIAPQEPTEAEQKIAALETEKVKLAEEKENYRKAYLKEQEKNKESGVPESEDDRVRRIVREEEANKRLSAIDTEKAALFDQTLKENKELKLAVLNKTGIPASLGSHSETSVPVRDTLVTSDQMAYFKAKGWSDKDIERYKKNLQKNGR